MSRPNFFNDNINRTFPFQLATAGVGTPDLGLIVPPAVVDITMLQLPDAVIADCGFIMGPESGYVEGRDFVYLYRIARAGSTFTFEFRADIHGQDEAGDPVTTVLSLEFTRQASDPIYTSEFSEAELTASCTEPLWLGYLVTGPISAIAERLSSGQAVVCDGSATPQARVEPALIQNLNGNQLVSLNLANGDRTRANRPSHCAPYVWIPEPQGTYVSQECLQGDLRLRSGYNISISQSNLSNTIQFAAIVRAGLGEPCGEVKLFAEEVPPEDASNNLLAGDFYCNEVLRSVNGLQGPSLTLFAGTGVAVLADSENNTLIVDINLTELSLCTYPTET